MSSAFDGLSNIYSLTAQINKLKDQASQASSGADPDLALLNIQKNFNEMLNDFISSSDDDDKKKSDSLTSLITNYQASISNANNQNNTQYDILTEQYKLNLDNIF